MDPMKQTQFKINKINKNDHNHLEAHLGDSEPGRPSLNPVVLNFRSSTCFSSPYFEVSCSVNLPFLSSQFVSSVNSHTPQPQTFLHRKLSHTL
ncbi:hypothetical protein HID58_056121 [Brassica napus]|uniref:Uncharacterized protein n=3 Tax=Brassica TaxID=3705 RepID=A0ABQ8AN68_BRANA|nr:hypothetical protein HID58_056121 [Brassica napus]